MLAAIALCVVTAMLIKYRNKLYAMVSAIPLCWLLIITTVAAYEKIFSEDSRVGFLAAARNIQDQISNPTSLVDIDVMQKIAFNLHLNIVIISILVIILWIVVIDVVKLLFQVKVYEKNI
jgi:carbon starvation protein